MNKTIRNKKIQKNKKKQKKQKKQKKPKTKRRNYAGRPRDLFVETEHESDGDIAAQDVINNLPGLPQNRSNEPYEIGALRRQKWLENEDFKAFVNSIQQRQSLRGVPIPKHLREGFTDQQIRTVLDALAPFTFPSKKYTRKNRKNRTSINKSTI